MRGRTILLSILILVLFAGAARAENGEGDLLTARELLSTPRGYALGNAMAASASGTSAVWHNPAGITSAVTYQIDSAYTFRNATKGHGFESNVSDFSTNSNVGAAMGVFYQYSSPEKQHIVNARLGIAVPLADNILSIGVSGVYSYVKAHGKRQLSQFSIDAGIIVRPVPWLAFGFSAQNLVSDESHGMPRMITAGVFAGSLQYGIGAMFDASFNVDADDIAASASYGAGLEYMLRDAVPLRIGYRYESSAGDHHVLTAGIGYRQQKYGIDIAYQHHFADCSDDLLSASIGVYF